MNIILNADAITHPLTGIGRYTLELANALPDMDAVNQLRLYSGGRWIEQPETALQANRWLSFARRWTPMKGIALNLYQRQRNRAFARVSGGLDDFILHSPNFLLLPFSGPSVVTVHDLSFIHHPESQPAYRRRFLQHHLPQSLAQASAVITPSEYVRQELIQHYDLAADALYAVPMGVSEMFYPHSSAQHAAVVQELQLPQQFVLCVATREPRKNLQRLLQAHAALPAALKRHYPLVLAGARGWLDKRINRDIERGLSSGSLYATGYVSEAQLAALYSAASVMALPSLYEGFGLPILEAMRSGTAVMTSHCTAMPEVAGGGAVLCDPLDVDDISRQLQMAIEHLSQDTATLQQQQRFAEKFSWSACARRTVGVYQQVSQAL